MIRIKKDLKDLNTTDLDFPEGTQLFINSTLCPYYRVLWNKYKKLWINKKKNIFCIKNMSKEALHDYFSKIYAQCYSLSIIHFLVFQTYGLALQFSTQPHNLAYIKKSINPLIRNNQKLLDTL